jgi:hypothetical protein
MGYEELRDVFMKGAVVMRPNGLNEDKLLYIGNTFNYSECLSDDGSIIMACVDCSDDIRVYSKEATSDNIPR